MTKQVRAEMSIWSINMRNADSSYYNLVITFTFISTSSEPSWCILQLFSDSFFCANITVLCAKGPVLNCIEDTFNRSMMTF